MSALLDRVLNLRPADPEDAHDPASCPLLLQGDLDAMDDTWMEPVRAEAQMLRMVA